MRKFFKIASISTGSLMILLGLIGGIIELSADKADLTGLILAPLFIVLGIGLTYLGMHRKKPGPVKSGATKNLPLNQRPIEQQQTMPETTTEKKTEEPPAKQHIDTGHVPWQRTFLIVAGSIETIFLVLTSIFALIFGIAGFIEGEMGDMVGLLMFGAVTGIGIIISVRAVALWGIVKMKQWAPALNLGLMIFLILTSLFSLAWPLMIYWGFEAWCSYFVLKHPMPATSGAETQ